MTPSPIIKIYEYWKKEHDKWYGRSLSKPTDHSHAKWAEAYDKMFRAKNLLTAIKLKQ